MKIIFFKIKEQTVIKTVFTFLKKIIRILQKSTLLNQNIKVI